ncbi:MAG: aminotransferase IV [Micromonosporaceae bacterium]|nr:aminotransferase IV [Micromonosporaceae bacterium]
MAVLGRGVVPAETAILRADDLGVLRGDGVFETVHVRDGEPWLLEPHLDRMARSAARLELDLPDRTALAELAAITCAAGPATGEGALRLVCTRGAEAGGPPTVFARLAPVPEPVRAGRRVGLAVVTATLGVAAAARKPAPWLLGGVKALSYAVNMASQRWAGTRAVDDVLWVSADGYALEAPTSSLVWLAGGVLCTVPAERTGILAGITVGWLLEQAPALGARAAERMVRPAELASADGVWLTSSVRGVAAVRELDGVALPVSPHTAKLQQLAGHPT